MHHHSDLEDDLLGENEDFVSEEIEIINKERLILIQIYASIIKIGIE